MRSILSILLAVTLLGSSQAQNFSCPFGKQGACLDYGDKVCSSLGKCVDQNAVCFDSYTCDFKGFVCKSDFDQLGNEYNSLLRKARSIAEDHNSLLAKYNDLVDEHNALIERYNNALRARQVFSDCVRDADTLDEAQRCY